MAGQSNAAAAPLSCSLSALRCQPGCSISKPPRLRFVRTHLSKDEPSGWRWTTTALLGGVLTCTSTDRFHRDRGKALVCATLTQGKSHLAVSQIEQAEEFLEARLYDSALACTEGVQEPRALFLHAAALAGLRKYKEAKQILDSLEGRSDMMLADFDVDDFRNKVECLQRQGEHGDFAFTEVFGPAIAARERGLDPALPSSKTDALFPQVPDYVGAVEVRETSKGRGLFATADLLAGEIILCCEPLVLATKEEADESGEPLLPALRRAVADSCHVRRVVSELLSDGKSSNEDIRLEDFAWIPSSDCETLVAHNSLDDARLMDVAQTNGFRSFGYSSVCGAVSMSNHSCVPNAFAHAVGHSILMRANTAISAGDEVCISYFDVLKPYKEREARTRHWNFRCNCPRCSFERSVPERLQSGGLTADEVEAAITDASNGIDVSSREAQWLRASHVLAYKAELEAEFPFSAAAAAMRQRVFRFLEATDPASFTHVKWAFLDWLLTKQTTRDGKDQATDRAMRYCHLVHQSRYGKVPKDQLVPLMKCTQQAAQATGVGEEFCSPWDRLDLKAETSDLRDAVLPSQTASVPATTSGTTFLD